MEGHRRIIEAGGWTGGPPPFGYRAVSSGTMKKLALDNGGEAETVRLGRVDGRRSGLFGIRSCQTTQRARQRPAPCCQVEPPESAACPPQRNHRRSMEVGETVRPCGNGHCAYPTNHRLRPVRRSAKGARSNGDRAAGTAPRLSSYRPCQLSMWLHFHRTVAEGSAPPLLPVPQQQTSIQRRSYRAMWLSEFCGRRYRDRGVETIVNVLSEPDRLLALAAEYLGERASQVPYRTQPKRRDRTQDRQPGDSSRRTGRGRSESRNRP